MKLFHNSCGAWLRPAFPATIWLWSASPAEWLAERMRSRTLYVYVKRAINKRSYCSLRGCVSGLCQGADQPRHAYSLRFHSDCATQKGGQQCPMHPPPPPSPVYGISLDSTLLYPVLFLSWVKLLFRLVFILLTGSSFLTFFPENSSVFLVKR